MRPDNIKITAKIDQYLPVALLAILYKIVLTSETVDKIVQCGTILIAFFIRLECNLRKSLKKLLSENQFASMRTCFAIV